MVGYVLEKTVLCVHCASILTYYKQSRIQNVYSSFFKKILMFDFCMSLACSHFPVDFDVDARMYVLT